MFGRLKWLLPAILLFIALIFLSISGRDPNQQNFISFAVLEAAAPLERGLTFLARSVEDIWRSYFYLVGLRQENEQLKETVERQNRQITQLNEHRAANVRLTALLALKNAYPNFVYLPTQVLAWDPGPWFRSIIINAGSGDGLIIGQAVIHPEGVVGRVVELTHNYARVLLATDFNSSIDAYIQSNRIGGILAGQGDRPLSLKYVRKDEDIRVGDLVVSSGLDGIFPKGLSLGTVSRINRRSADMFAEVEVSPAVDFNRLEEVLVVLNSRLQLDWLSLGPSLRPLINPDELRENSAARLPQPR